MARVVRVVDAVLTKIQRQRKVLGGSFAFGIAGCCYFVSLPGSLADKTQNCRGCAIWLIYRKEGLGNGQEQ